MKTKFLAAAASVAFIATGVAAMAQEAPKHGQSPAAGGAMQHEQGAQAQSERREQMNGPQGAGARAEGPQNELKGQGAERSRAAEAPGQERKAGEGAERSRAAEAPGQERKAGEGAERSRAAEAPGQERKTENRAAEQNHQQTPAARTGANEQQHNGAKTGAAENKTGAAENKTGAAETKPGAAPRTGAAETKGTNERTGAAEGNRANERTGAAETNRNANRTAEQNGQRGQAQVRGNVHMSSEHATRVSESLRRDMKPERVGISIRVGERVPEHVHIRPLPQEVIAIVPEYRGYDYFIDENDEIVFVSPQTHEIVGMIEYEGRAASEDVTRVRAARPCPTED